VVNLLLNGLFNETTPLSDTYIQSSVSSTLEYISLTLPTVASIDSTIITRSAAIFNQMTITENSMVSAGQYTKFSSDTVASLFRYANNIFQSDYSSLIGISRLFIFLDLYCHL
jgi:hypothetical protein